MKHTKRPRSLPLRLIDNLLLISWVALFHFSLGYSVKTIYVVVVFFAMRLVATASPLLCRVIMVAFTILGMGYMSVGAIYGSPDVNVIGSLMYTHAAESREYLSGLPMSIWALSALLCLLGVILFVRSPGLRLPPGNRRVIAVVFCIVATLWSPVRKGELTKLELPLPEYRFIQDTWKAYKGASQDRNTWASIINQQAQWEPTVLGGQRDIYVLVIGESVRRDYVHAFGDNNRFPADYTNTPWLDNAPATLYTRYVSAASATVPSLTNTLAFRRENTRELNNSIVTLAQAAGLETWWLSNQGQKGRHDSPVALIGSRADHVTFLKPGNSDDRSPAPDTELLPLLDDALMADTPKRKLIVLHLMGSHPRACVRTHDTFDRDMGSKELSCYVKSIAQTDTLLSQVVESLRQHQATWSMVYFADHGLSYIDKDTSHAYLTHSDTTRENYEVPFFVLNSEDTRQQYVDKPYSGLDFLPLFADWLYIKDDHLPPAHMYSTKVLDYDGNMKDINTLPSVH